MTRTDVSWMTRCCGVARRGAGERERLADDSDGTGTVPGTDSDECDGTRTRMTRTRMATRTGTPRAEDRGARGWVRHAGPRPDKSLAPTPCADERDLFGLGPRAPLARGGRADAGLFFKFRARRHGFHYYLLPSGAGLGVGFGPRAPLARGERVVPRSGRFPRGTRADARADAHGSAPAFVTGRGVARAPGMPRMRRTRARRTRTRMTRTRMTRTLLMTGP